MNPTIICTSLAVLLAIFFNVKSFAQAEAGQDALLPPDWDPKAAADSVMVDLVNVCAPEVKGAHDSDLLIVGDKAYIIYMANDVQPSENPRWHFVYNAMSIVDLATREVEDIIPFAATERAYDNVTLPPGSCFVPRLLKIDDSTLRCFFASEAPGERESQAWYIDFNIESRTFNNQIHEAYIITTAGERLPMQPQHYYNDAVRHGFEAPQLDYGVYFIDSFKYFDDKIYAVMNNFPIGQNALIVVEDDMKTFRILGHFNEPNEYRLSEAAIQRMPDGSWLAINRQSGGTQRYTFSKSVDGIDWTVNEYWEMIPASSSSKATFDRFDGVYYLGWQDATEINNVHRSVFNIEISRDGENWERKYRFETENSFQYPVFRQHNGTIYLTATQGDHSNDRKERIMFGVLE